MEHVTGGRLGLTFQLNFPRFQYLNKMIVFTLSCSFRLNSKLNLPKVDGYSYKERQMSSNKDKYSIENTDYTVGQDNVEK